MDNLVHNYSHFKTICKKYLMPFSFLSKVNLNKLLSFYCKCHAKDLLINQYEPDYR